MTINNINNYICIHAFRGIAPQQCCGVIPVLFYKITNIFRRQKMKKRLYQLVLSVIAITQLMVHVYSQDVKTLSGHSGNINCIAFSPDAKKFASSGEDGSIIIWESATGSKIDNYSLGGNITSVKYSQDNKLLGATTLQGVTFLLNPENGAEIAKFRNAHRHYSISFSSNKKYVAVNYFYMTDHYYYEDGKKYDYKKYHYEVALCDENLKQLRTIKVLEKDIKLGLFLFGNNLTESYRANYFSSLFTSDSKNLIITGANGNIVVYSIEKNNVALDLRGHDDKVFHIDISPDGGYFASASKDESIIIWNSSTFRKHKTLSGHKSDVNTVCFSPDGKYLVSSGDDKSVRTWDILTGKMISKLKGFNDDVLCAAFSPDGKYITSGSKAGKIRMWDTENILPDLKIFAEDFDYEGLSGNFLSEKELLSSNVNSPYTELRPIISPDGRKLYFVRQDHPENYGSSKEQDIWVSALTQEGEWSIAYNIGPPINNKYPNHIGGVTPDGNTLVIGHVYNSDGTLSSGISITNKKSDGWSFPEKLNIKNYYNDGKYLEYYLSNSGKILLMTVERNDSYGDRDVYASFSENDGNWSEPMNLGPVVNSSSEEISPFLASDEKTLYYSSKGKGGFGDADLFMSRRLDDTWKNWSEPENMGEQINTSGFDAYYFFSASGEYAYFVSSSAGNNEDIYRIKIPKRVRSEPVFMVSGKVLDSRSGQPIDAKIYYEMLPSGIEQGIARTDPATGDYKITLPKGRKYGFRAEADGYLSVNDNIDASELSRYKEIERNLYLVPIQVGETIKLNNIFFDSGKFQLKDESFPELQRVVSFLNQNPGITIQISGHTDNVNTDEYNLKLSENRAKAVYTYLLQNNILASRVTFKGFGESNPVASNDTEEGRQLNRRVEFTITGK